MSSFVVSVVKEVGVDERRVALVPDGVTRLSDAGAEVLVEANAGAAAWFPDDAYTRVGATVAAREEVIGRADVLLTVGAPGEDVVAGLRPGSVLIGLLAASPDSDLLRSLAARSITVLDLARLPRTLSRAQPMDALTSQANVAGYKAVLVAANAFGRYLPMLMTAAGTVRPAEVLVLGVGVAGLQAIGTARRLGGVVRAYDIRPETRTEVESVGGTFLELTTGTSGSGEGGYARALTAEEQEAQRVELARHVAQHDIVITTAQVPGRRPPVLLDAETVKGMRPGSVVVDIAASAAGGNVELSRPDETIVTDEGVTVIGAGNLPSAVPTAASNAYSRNVGAVLSHLLHEGRPRIDLDDEIQTALVVTHDGQLPGSADPAGQRTGGASPTSGGDRP